MEARLAQLAHVMEQLVRFEVIRIGPVSITSTVVNTWIVMAVLFAVVWLLTRGGIHFRPKGGQVVLEMFVDFIHGLMDPNLGREGRKFLFLPATLFLFIFFLNISWFIPGFAPPTTDVMTTAALGVTSIIVIQLMGLREKGLGGYLKNFAQPVAIMAPMNMIEEVVKPFSLAIRLFGNMFGEKTVVTILGILMPLLLPVPVMFLGLLMGGIQAFIFTLLCVTYLATATKGH